MWWLSSFAPRRPAFETPQQRLLEWLAEAHAAAEATRASLTASDRDAFRARIGKVIARVACDPTQIQRRGHVIADPTHTDWERMEIYDLSLRPRGAGSAERNRCYAGVVTAYLRDLYAATDEPPGDLIHVTCTGYVAPSGAQELVARRGWGARTRVTHAYHMGCYAAVPALRLAAGLAAQQQAGPRPARADIVHTELCSLHFDPASHSPEQLVVQSLFADGLISYRVEAAPRPGSLRLLASHELILPDSTEAMGWTLGDHGMSMTLARDVPERVAGALARVVGELYRRAGLDADRELARSAAAVHPGGPRIVDGVRDALHLDEAQLAASRAVLRDCGNMSSATLPHVWARLAADPGLPAGTPVLSLAFGPGLTISAALLEKE